MVSLPKKIIFYRIGAIGDIIHTLPLVQLTRELNPQARIEYIVGSKQIAELLELYAGYIDKIHCIQHKGIFDRPAGFFPSKEEQELIRSLKKDPVDEFIYLHGNQLKASLLNLRFIKAKKLFIYKRDESLSAVSNYVVSRYPELREDLKENPYRVLKSNTLKTVKPSELKEASKKSISIVLGVGKLRPTRAYPLSSWARLIEKLLCETDYQIHLLGGPDELDLSEEFMALMQKRIENLHYGWLEKKPDTSRINNLIGKTSLVELAGILKTTDRVFSADTGILHIAAALDAPITSVFSITSEQRFGPFKKDAVVLRSSKCLCEQSYTNLPKHCDNTVCGYAKCMYDIELLGKETTALLLRV